MPIKTISDHLYRVRIHFVYKEPMEKAWELIKSKPGYFTREKFEHCFKKGSGFVCWADEQDICLILCNRLHKSDKVTAGTMVHELFHVTDNILHDKGLSLTESSSEAYAYYLGWLMDQLTSFVLDCENPTGIKSRVKSAKKRK